jgi:hypothetical protein
MKKSLGLGRPLWHGVLASWLGAVPLLACGGGAELATEPARAPVATAQPPAAASTGELAETAAPAVEHTSVSEASATAPAAAEPARTLPTGCEPGTEPCSAPAKFVERLCHGKFSEVALVMFSKGTPWRRGYVKAEKVEPVNIYEGERSERWLEFGEEVLVLRTRGPGSGAGVQVSGPTDVDVLRWDGTCATIRQEMLRPYPTNTSVLTARIVWKHLDTPIQDALLASPIVAHASEREKPLCRGSTMKHPDAACDKASQKLTDAITVALRGGLALPTPAKLPAWPD